MKIKTFSQALALLEQRGIQVEHLGRLARYGCLMWRVDGKELDKAGVIDYAERLPAPEGTTVLVACVRQKRIEAAAARDLYVSEWFTRARAYAENFGDRWYILSAKYGLVDPDMRIEPYDQTLSLMSRDERAVWGSATAAQIRTLIDSRSVALQILAGLHYREPLLPHLTGYAVDVPMAGLGIGQQIAWLGHWAVQEVPA